MLPILLLELCASVLFIIAFGVGNFLAFLLLSMVLGAVLLAIFWKNMLEFQVLSPKQMLMQFSFVICAFLLIIPGVLSSVFGFLVLIFGFALNARRKKKTGGKRAEEEIIDVEIIEDRK